MKAKKKDKEHTDRIENFLDIEQQRAIKFGEGPLLIVAGAGTGKTKVITERIAWLINEKKVEPSSILALTFSEKAAAEMSRRVDELVPYGMIDTHISTFHSFGYDIIDDNFAELKIAPDWKLLKDADAIIFIAENIDNFDLDIFRPLNNPHKYVDMFATFISRLKDNLITPDDYIKYAENFLKSADTEEKKEIAKKHIELSKFYKKYEELKTEKNFMDYGDLIMVPYFLFKNKKSVLEKYQKKYKYILIDEFQDTNYAQFELIKLIAEKEKNITVVGDDDQMIYRFRGAAISNIMGFKDYYNNAEVIVLKTNYRSAQPILDAAYKLIKNNTDRLEEKLKISKKLESRYKPEHRIKSLNIEFFRNYSYEADFIVGEIKRLLKYYSLKDIAILVRSKADALIFLKTLEKEGIPYRFSGDEGLFNKPEVMFLINFCKMLNTPYEFNPLFDVAISEYYQINPYTMTKIGNRAKDFSLPVYEMMKNVKDYTELEISDEEILKLQKLVKDIEFYVEKIKERWSAGEILYDFLKSRKMFDELLKANTIEAERKIANISKFFEILRQFSINEEYDTLPNFVKYIELRQLAGDKPQEELLEDIKEDCVQVLTVHKAKGLEFKVVFLVALVQDKFPVRKKGSSPLPLPEEIMKDIVDEETYFKEEERRLFYVAMTRAKEALYLTASQKYEGKSNRKISIFLKEIGAKEPEELKEIEEPTEKFGFFMVKSPLAEVKIEKKDKLIKLSNYQIDDYLTCPFKYKLIHILKIPIRAEPAVMYGQAMHKVVAEFFKSKKEGRQLTLDDLIFIFKSVWRPEGFISREHEKRRFDAGIENIKKFYEKEKENNVIPESIEKDFEFKLSENLIITGRWDRIDKTKDGVVIIDYKTSDVENKTIEELKEKLDKSDSISRQLKLYALAYQEVYKAIPAAVGIYFIENCILVTKKIKEKTLETYKEKIFEVAERIKKEDFEATPSSFVCSYCLFFNICPYSRADVLF